MSNNVVRVNPVSVSSYKTNAQTQFDSMYQDLVKLVDSVVNVHYFGPNAVKFKTDCGILATQFANGLSKELGGIAGCVNVATSNIAASLGAARSTLNWSARAFSAPTPPAGDGSVDVDHSALVTLKSTVSSHFSSISSALGEHLSNLVGTDWTGKAKDQVVDEVTGRTSTAKNKVQESQTSLNNFIQQQVDDVISADRI